MAGGEGVEKSTEAVSLPSGASAGAASPSVFLSYASSDADTANTVLLAHGRFVFIGTLVGRVVVVIDSTGDWWRNREVRGQCLLTFRDVGIRFLCVWFAHDLVLLKG